MESITNVSEGITGIGHLAIRARNLDTLLTFYTDTLGFPELFRLTADDGSIRLVYVRVIDAQFLEFFPNGEGDGPAPREAVGLNHLCLTVSDLDSVVEALTTRGVALTRPLITGGDGNRQAWIDDPEGNRIELMEMSPVGMQAQAIAQMHAAK